MKLDVVRCVPGLPMRKVKEGDAGDVDLPVQDHPVGADQTGEICQPLANEEHREALLGTTGATEVGHLGDHEVQIRLRTILQNEVNVPIPLGPSFDENRIDGVDTSLDRASRRLSSSVDR